MSLGCRRDTKPQVVSKAMRKVGGMSINECVCMGGGEKMEGYSVVEAAAQLE